MLRGADLVVLPTNWPTGAIGTACTNAKNNVKEACEGIVEPDKKYEFDDKKKE